MASELVSLFGGVHDQIVSSHPRSRSPPRLPFLSPPPILETPGEFTPRRNATAPMTLKQYLKEKPGPQSETTPRQSVCSSTSPRSGAVTTSGGNMRSSPETSHAHSDGLSRFKQIVLAQQHSVKGARAATADACVQLLRAIKTLPKEGNSVPKLVQELRRVLQVLLDGLEELHEMTLNAHQHHLVSSFSTPGQTQTTLGLVLLNNLVDNLLPGGPAHLAGIRKGDAILEVDGVQSNKECLQSALQRTDLVGDKVRVTYLRRGEVYKATLVRMSADRVQSIRELIEMLSKAATHLIKTQDSVAVSHNKDILDGFIQIVAEQQRVEQVLNKYIQQTTSLARTLLDAAEHIFNRIEFETDAWTELQSEEYSRPEEIRRLGNVLQKVAIYRLKASAQSRAWNAWRELLSYSRIARRAVTWWFKNSLFKALQTWISMMMEARRIAKAVARWKARDVVRCWEKWREEVRRRYLVQKVVGLWKKRDLVKACGKWWGQVCRSRRARKSVARWLNTTTSKAWRGWQRYMVESTRLQSSAEKVVRRWKQLSTAQAWRSWVEKHIEFDRLRAVAAKVVGRWMWGCMSRAWGSWMAEVTRAQRLRETMTRSIRHWIKIPSAAAFMRWVEQTTELRRLRLICIKVVKRWMNGVLAAVLMHWKSEKDEQKRLRSVARKMVLRWGNKQYAGAFRRWVEQTTEQRRLRLTSTKVVRRWMNGMLTVVWMQWQFQMQELKWLRTVTNKIVLRWDNMKYAGAVKRWVERTAEQRRLRLTCTKVVKRWMNGVLAAVWIQWQSQKDEQQRLRTVLSRVTRRWKYGCLWMAFARWTDELRSEPTAVKVSLDLDFETTVVSPDDKAKFERQLRLDICSSLGLRTEDLVILCNQAESVVSTVVFVRPASEALAQEFAALVANTDSNFYRTPIGKHVKGVAICGPVSKDALGAIVAAKNEDETRRAYEVELAWRREEMRRSVKVRRSLMKYLNKNVYRALRTWQTYFKEQKHMRTVRFKISEQAKRRTIYRAWASWCTITQFMIDFKNLGPRLDDEYFANMCNEESRMWIAALGSHEAFERQLLDHQRRRFWEEQKLIAHRKTPKLLQNAGDCDTPDTVSVFSPLFHHHSAPSVAEVKPAVHARGSSQRATPIFAALNNPLNLIPGTPGYLSSPPPSRPTLSKTTLQEVRKANGEQSPPPPLPPTAVLTPSPPPLPPRPLYVGEIRLVT